MTVPYEFSGITVWQLKMRLFGLFWLTAFFPAFAVFLLWRLKFSESIFCVHKKKESFLLSLPCSFTGGCIISAEISLISLRCLNSSLWVFLLPSSIGLVCNNFFKISLHGMGMGGALAAVILFSFYYQLPMGLPIAVTTLLTGIVCTSAFW